ncbi:NapC/NirT family cytochrome c [candidate division KSB1 bacterium]
MVEKYKRFIHSVSANKFGKTGVILTTSSFITGIIFEMARLAGIITNSYVGLITYLVIPLVFLTGLILIPVGWIDLKKKTGKSTEKLLEQAFDKKDLKKGLFGSNVFATIALLTVGNVLFLGGVSSQMLHFMDGPEFCGTACHDVMNPEWTTYKNSPHARVACVECHVGEGVDALVSSKLNGIRQMFLAAFDLYNRPVPTPVHQLRPARETCEKCHWPEKFYGNRIKNIIHYKKDEGSTPFYTTLDLKIDTGTGQQKSGIHWHILTENEVRYLSADEGREKMVYVDVKMVDGSFKRYSNKKYEGAADTENEISERVLDCIDCHNRATHIYQDPEVAVEDLIQKGLIDVSLPFIKREALGAVTRSYPDNISAERNIELYLMSFYEREFPDILIRKRDSIEKAVEELIRIYNRNVHLYMNLEWNNYPSFIGHNTGTGCFRCHNQDMVDEEGNFISNDCTLCHSILAFDEDEPFKYLQPVDEEDRNAKMHRYLREEFFEKKRKN